MFAGTYFSADPWENRKIKTRKIFVPHGRFIKMFISREKLWCKENCKV